MRAVASRVRRRRDTYWWDPEQVLAFGVVALVVGLVVGLILGVTWAESAKDQEIDQIREYYNDNFEMRPDALPLLPTR